MCPVLCSGNGDYEDGVCRCFPGWKGIECQLRSNECEIADCNGHGKCVNGVCNCARGFTGKHCKEGIKMTKHAHWNVYPIHIIWICGFILFYNCFLHF